MTRGRARDGFPGLPADEGAWPRTPDGEATDVGRTVATRPGAPAGPARRPLFGGDDLHLPTREARPPVELVPRLQTRIVSIEHLNPRGLMTAESPRGPAPRPAAEAQGTLVSFLSCHGGTGSTLLATNVGAILASLGRPTCVVDLDLQVGDVTTILGLECGYPMSRIARDMEAFDWQMVAPQVPRHGSGLCVLSQVGHVEELSELDAGRIPTFLRYLQQHFHFVLVDGIRDFNDHAIAALDVTDKILLTATQDVLAIRGAGLRLKILKQLGYPDERAALVLNRFDPKAQVRTQHVSDALGIAPAFLVGNDFGLAHRSITEGRTLKEVAPDAVLTREVEAMTHALFDIPLPPRKPSFWARFRRRTA